jgi:hypothetical protein
MNSEVQAYVGVVTSTSGRAIKAKSASLSDKAGDIYPLIFGSGIKLPVPKVGDQVLILSLDILNNFRYYIPLGSIDQVKADSDDPTKFIVGTSPTEPAVLGTQLKTLLEQLADMLTPHIHNTAIGPASPSANLVPLTAWRAQLITILSQIQLLK